MMKIKRIAAFVLSLVMLLPVFNAAAETESESAAINKTTEAKLMSFGILERDDDLLYEEYLTRGAFVEYCSRLLGEEMQPLKGSNPFVDVKEEDEHYKSIMLFYELGYVSGGEGASFRPDDEIKLEEAAKVLLGILGYGDVGAKIAYPSGYLKIAYELDLFDSINSDGHIDSYEMAELMLNVLHTPLLDVEKIHGSGGALEAVYYSDKGADTLLKRNFDIYYWEGILEDNKYTSLYGSSEVSEDSVVINGKAFKTGETDSGDMVGYYVNSYYRDEDEQQTIIYIEKDENKNHAISIRGKDIEDNSVTQTGFTYWDKENSKRVEVNTERALIMMYNGVLHPYDKEYITDKDAHLTFLDNDNDKRAEIVYVMKYRTVVVASASSNGQISDKLGGAVVDLDPESDEFDVFITGEKGKMTPKEIQTGDVLSVAVPMGKNPEVKYVFVSRQVLEGAITQMDEDGIYINDVFYEITPDCKDTSIMGWNGKFMLDAFGTVVHKVITRDMVYGYLNKIAIERGILKAKIFTENNRWVTLDFKNKFTFNEEKVSAKDFYAEYGDSTDNYRQLVRYTVNENAEIAELVFAEETDPWSSEHVSKMNDGVFSKKTLKNSAVFRSTIKGFVREIESGAQTEQLLLTNETKVFMIPYQPENESADDEDFFVVGVGDMVQDQRYKNITGYDCDEFLQAKACTLVDDSSFKNNAKFKSGGNFLLVSKLKKGILESGEETDIICGMYSGTEITIKTANESIISAAGGIQPGDVIQFALDQNGNIGNIAKRYDSAKNGFTPKIGGDSTNLYAQTTLVAGEVVKYDSELKRIAFNCGKYSVSSGAVLDRIVVATMNDASNIYLYDVDLEEAKKITPSEIQPGDYVFGMLSYYRFTQIVVYRP